MMLLHMAERESSTRTVVKVGLIVVAAIGAIYFALRGSGDQNQQPDTPESAVAYICWEDNTVFDLTPAQWAEPERTKVVDAGNPNSGVRMGGRLMVKCPKCNQYAAVEARKCPDGKFVASVTKNNELVECPK